MSINRDDIGHPKKWQVNSIAPLAGSLFGHTGYILKIGVSPVNVLDDGVSLFGQVETT